MNISFDRLSICSRAFNDFTILYDLQNKTILRLENVAADIWKCICSTNIVTDKDIVDTIANDYDCETDMIREDVIDFLDDLYSNGIISIDGIIKKVNPTANNSDGTFDDYEGIIIQELTESDQLYSATIEMTYSCNEKCIHCYAHYPSSSPSHNCTLHDYKHILDELNELNCMHLAFTGGDPFMHDAFLDVFRYSRKLGFVCDIFTNGLYLYDNPKVVNEIIQLMPRAFFISLYGSSPEIHDNVTQTKGSFEKTISIAQLLKSKGIPVVFNIMVLTINCNDLPNMISLSKTLGIEYRWSLSIINRNDGDSSPMNYFVSDKRKIQQCFQSANDKIYSFDKPVFGNEFDEYMCGAGISTISIAPDGTIFPCVSLKVPLGNIKDSSIESSWNSKRRIKLRNSLKWTNTEKCFDCNYRSICPHCPGISQSETGNMLSCNKCDFTVAECLYGLLE